jgi:cytochrome c-type biogenesis protein
VQIGSGQIVRERVVEPLWTLLLMPMALGLLGFIEPCSIGASLLFLKSVEGNTPAVKVMQAGVFTLTRAVLIGLLGALAAVVGTVFLGFQRFGYVLLGTVYVVLGIIYLSGHASKMTRSFGPSLGRLSTVRGSAAMAAFFGLNVPACSTPLLAAVLSSAAVAGAKVGQGFLMLALFGFALSLPLLLAMMFEPAQRLIEWLGRYSMRVPVLIGALFVLLGAWSIRFGVVAPWSKA